MVDKNTFHNDSLQLFNEKIFEGILGLENVTSKKRTIKIDGDKCYGFFIEKGRHKYFLEDFSSQPGESVLDKLPIKVKKTTEMDYNKDVFFFINDYTSVKIPEEPRMPLRQVVDAIGNFNHTNRIHWLLYKIITIAGWCDRVNYRVVAERGFGKDSIINIVRDLVGNTANIYGATFAKLEFSLTNKLLIFNEMGNLKAEEKQNMQQFLLAIGAFFNKYTKRSRATEDTQEEYDISKQSLGIIYNPPMYYVEKGQEWFDVMFTQAVSSRFIPFYLDGRLNEKFDTEFNVAEVVDRDVQVYKDIISTLRWYKNQPVVSRYTLPDDIEFNDETRRFERSFTKICDYISEYAKDDEKLYYELVYALYAAYKNYDAILAEALARR